MYLLRVVSFFFVAISAFFGCTADILTLPYGVLLNRSNAVLAPGETLQLVYEVLPDEAEIKTVKWNSSDLEVATIVDGLITAKGEGNAVITVTTISGQRSATFFITVIYPVHGISLNESTAILSAGKQLRLFPAISPENAPETEIRWSSDNPAIASVDEGTVTAYASGTAIISAITEIGERVATCAVRVVQEKHVTMRTQIMIDNVNLMIAGSGTIKIDWGDGTPQETFTLTNVPVNRAHQYSRLSQSVITIEGDDIAYIRCSNNQLTGLDVSNVPELETLICRTNLLTELDISKNKALINLDCANNQLTDLDISHNPILSDLDCSHNRLRNININNTQLVYFKCDANSFSSLHIDNTKIQSLYFYDLPLLEELKVKNNNELTSFRCSSVSLRNLTLENNSLITEINVNNSQRLDSLFVIRNLSLKTLNCRLNSMLSLTVSANPVLTSIDCYGNQLTSLNMSGSSSLVTLRCMLNNFSADALDAMFNTLHRNTSSDNTVYIFRNPGTYTCNRSLATSKGWIVNDSLTF